MKTERLLYLGPNLPAYHVAFINALKKHVQVDYFPYFKPMPFTTHLSQAGLYPTKEKAERNHYAKLLTYVNYDFILICAGFQLSEEIYKKLRINNPRARFINFHWDSLKERYNYLPIMKHFDKVYSFDIQDCKNHPEIEYLPLFFIDEYRTLRESQKLVKPSIDLLFVGGWRSMERYETVLKIKQYCCENGLVFKYYLYLKAFTFFDALYRGTFIKDVNFKLLSHKQIIKMFAKSRVILDISNSFQSGYTMRTIETLGSGKKLITTNSNILNEPFYDESIISVISPDSLNFDLNFIKDHSQTKIIQDIENFSVHSYVKRLLNSN